MQNWEVPKGLRIESVREIFRQDIELCNRLLGGLQYEKMGECKLCKLKPSKDNGYIQLSALGANKFAVLQEVLLWASGVTQVVRDDNLQCSHRCGHPSCLVPGHVCLESAQKNNQRKNCLVYIDCPHCDLKILVCSHSPTCLKEIPVCYSNWEDFISNGIHQWHHNASRHDIRPCVAWS